MSIFGSLVNSFKSKSTCGSDYNKFNIELSQNDILNYIQHAATQEDIRSLRSEIKYNLDKVESRIDKVESSLTNKIDKVESKLDRLLFAMIGGISIPLILGVILYACHTF